MATSLSKPISRMSNTVLDGSHGPYKHKRVVITIIPGREGTPDIVEMRPEGTSAKEYIPLTDIYRIALRRRIG